MDPSPTVDSSSLRLVFKSRTAVYSQWKLWIEIGRNTMAMGQNVQVLWPALCLQFFFLFFFFVTSTLESDGPSRLVACRHGMRNKGACFMSWMPNGANPSNFKAAIYLPPQLNRPGQPLSWKHLGKHCPARLSLSFQGSPPPTLIPSFLNLGFWLLVGLFVCCFFPDYSIVLFFTKF